MSLSLSQQDHRLSVERFLCSMFFRHPPILLLYLVIQVCIYSSFIEFVFLNASQLIDCCCSSVTANFFLQNSCICSLCIECLILFSKSPSCDNSHGAPIIIRSSVLFISLRLYQHRLVLYYPICRMVNWCPGALLYVVPASMLFLIWRDTL